MRIPKPAAVLLLIAGVLLLLSCKNDSYESGDSRYSYLTAAIPIFVPTSA